MSGIHSNAVNGAASKANIDIDGRAVNGVSDSMDEKVAGNMQGNVEINNKLGSKVDGAFSFSHINTGNI